MGGSHALNEMLRPQVVQTELCSKLIMVDVTYSKTNVKKNLGICEVLLVRDSGKTVRCRNQ